MLKKYFLLFSLFCTGENLVQAQPYSIVIKGGHIIDPKNNIDELMDIAIKGDTIVRLQKPSTQKMPYKLWMPMVYMLRRASSIFIHMIFMGIIPINI